MDLAANRSEVGDLLLEQGKLTERQLELARRRQSRLDLPQHRAIVELNYASEEDTYRALAILNNLEFVDLCKERPPNAVLQSVPVKLIFHYQMVPISFGGDLLTLAFSEPPKQMEQGNLRLLLGIRLKIVLSTPSCVHSIIKTEFGLGAETIQKLREEHGASDLNQEIVFDVKSSETDAAVDATIADFVDQILLEALRLQATDVHIEPYHSSIRLRYRIDGFEIRGHHRAILRLHEGKNREIRQLFRSAGYRVGSLTRTRIGIVGTKGLATGECRELKKHEVDWFIARGKV